MFLSYLRGLSDASRWREWASKQPVEVEGHAEVSALISRM